MHKLHRTQFLPISLEEAWSFFSNPGNLNLITPDALTFVTTSEVPEKMYEGLIITYRIKPMLNIPVDWVTEITHIRDGEYFVDEQRKGPYRIWHHEHHFKAVEGGVMMTDLLYYDIGKWIFGRIAGALFVHRKVNEIFDFRQVALEKYFPLQKAKTV
ncbi:MAG: SRPBCC family protein [Saprospiraceae bacterium]|nr:SRPBCC family protein [Saprospiraceae bacterium]